MINMEDSYFMAPRKPHRSEASKALAKAIIAEYKPNSAAEIHDALKDIFGPMFEALLQGEMDAHLGYGSSERGVKATPNRRNGYTNKSIKTSSGDMEIQVPRDRDSSFEPKIVPKRSKDVSEIENKVISMYAKGMSQRDIADTIQDIYGFEMSADTISNITDRVIDTANEWQVRPLKKFYAFVFVDCLYVNIRHDNRSENCAVYVILGYDSNGVKDILGIWIGDNEGKHRWMQIFDEIKNRGVEDILFLSMDGVSGLEDGVKSIFPKTVVQRCIVHLMRNSLKYVATKDYKQFAAQIKAVYSAVNLAEAQRLFKDFKANWEGKYPGAVDVWERNFIHIEQLFNYGSAIRKVMYTTNAIESVNSSLRKVTKKGSFPSDSSVLKALYLRVTELYKKWKGRPISNWAMVRNQIIIDDKLKERFTKNDCCE